jgi:hypothetical protein
MGLREILQKYRIAVIGVITVVIIYAIWTIVSQVTPAPNVATRVYFTSDDGNSFFTDSIDLVPPVQINGKEAVRAYVYENEKGKFVGYMMRYTPTAKAAIERFVADSKTEAFKKAPPASYGPSVAAYKDGPEYKRPGDSTWESKPKWLNGQPPLRMKGKDGSEGKLAELP